MDVVFSGVLNPTNADKDQDIVVNETDIVPKGGGEKISEVEIRPQIKEKELYQDNKKDLSLNDNTPLKDSTNFIRANNNDGISMVELLTLQGNTLIFS